MIDTGGHDGERRCTRWKERGAKKVYAAADARAACRGRRRKKLPAAPLEELVVTNTIHIPRSAGSRR
jgi:phosphoribosylpyrophosphate synthetase